MGIKAEEDKIERYLVSMAPAYGGLAVKMEPEGHAHWPDRVVLFNDDFYYWVEVKAPNGKLSPGQVSFFKQLTTRGQRVYIIDSKEKVDCLYDLMESHEHLRFKP